MYKKLSVLLLVLLLAFSSATAEGGNVGGRNPETGCIAVIDDAAGLLTPREYEDVLAEMMKITDYCNVGFYTCDTGSSTYVMDKAKAWGRQNFSGDYTVFVIDMTTRRIAVYSSERIYKTVTTARSNSITDNVYRYASEKRYGDCAVKAFSQILFVLKGENIPEPMRYAGNALLAVLAAILLAYMFISARMEQEVKVSLPEVVTATVGAGAVIAGKKLSRVVHHSSSSGGGGGGGGFGGGGGGGGGSHGF